MHSHYSLNSLFVFYTSPIRLNFSFLFCIYKHFFATCWKLSIHLWYTMSSTNCDWAELDTMRSCSSWGGMSRWRGILSDFLTESLKLSDHLVHSESNMASLVCRNLVNLGRRSVALTCARAYSDTPYIDPTKGKVGKINFCTFLTR